MWSNDPNVDPVGACVGARGSRVRMVTNELRGERVDVVPFSDDPVELIQNALAPARVREVRLDDETGTATVVVSDYQLSLAIGKEGQNARLAARLTGWRIDIKSETQLAEEEAGYGGQEWAEGEWVENESGEMVWKPAEGGDAISAEEWTARRRGAGRGGDGTVDRRTPPAGEPGRRGCRAPECGRGRGRPRPRRPRPRPSGGRRIAPDADLRRVPPDARRRRAVAGGADADGDLRRPGLGRGGAPGCARVAGAALTVPALRGPSTGRFAAPVDGGGDRLRRFCASRQGGPGTERRHARRRRGRADGP